MFPRDRKTISSRKDIWGIGTKWFPVDIKSVSTGHNKRFVVKMNLQQTEKSFNCQDYLRKKKNIGFL